MLKSLSIDNYALIEHSEIDFNKGFSVITGETGAGKSIMLGALGLLVGAKADAHALKNAERKCVVEAVFDVSAYHLQGLFSANELDYDDECVIRREIAPSGKSRAFVNDSPVNVSILKELGDHLIDIHSQHQNLLLSNANFQLNVVDVVAGNASALADFKQDYDSYRAQVLQLKKMKEAADKSQSDLDYIQFQYKSLSDAKLVAGEQTELEEEQLTLQNADNIKEALSKALWLLDENEESVNKCLKDAIGSLNEVSDSFSAVNDKVERLNSSLIELKDVCHDLDALQNNVEGNPERLAQVSARLDELYTLERKFKVESVEELMELCKKFEKQLQAVSSSDEDIAELEAKVAELRSKLVKKAAKLSESRQKQAPVIEKELGDLLHNLGMPNAVLQIKFDKASDFSETGLDIVSFLFSANKDRNLQPIADIASGGEMARVMLSLKSVLSRSQQLPTIIFDEIDTGVSGDIAAKMGAIMQQMGQRMQVISITHLPQIAAKGEFHYKVYKTDSADTTTSHIQLLTEDERVDFIAHLLSGDRLTDAAIQNAKELLSAK